MKIKILRESGHREAIFGMRLSHGVTSGLDFFLWAPTEKDLALAAKLAVKDGGHNKFLESIAVWVDITAPRYWWSQFDCYRSGVTKQSESTMHTLLHRHVTDADFERLLPKATIDRLNHLIDSQDIESAKSELPECFLQRRIVCCNYKSLRTIISQRANHKLNEWRLFVAQVMSQVAHPEYLK